MISTVGAAIAADPPRKAPAAVPAPLTVATWTGCYLTGGVGYGMWNQDNQTFNAIGLPADAEHIDGGRGWLGRVGGGCDYQFAQKWVIGALADCDFARIKGDMSLPDFGWQGLGEKNNWSWAAGARVGYLPWDQLLVFISGGYTESNFKQVNLSNLVGNLVGFHIGETSYTGWWLGSGYEYRFDWLPSLYWKTEYRFADLGSQDNAIINTATGVPTGEFVHSRKFIQTVTSSLVWRFGGWR